MPPKQKITREMILEAGIQLARKNGIDNVNSRNVAKELSCSTQPVFSQFATMEELRKGVFDYACDMFVDEVLQNADNPDFLRLSTLWYINLMRNEKNLYTLLYFSSGFDNGRLTDVLIGNFKSNRMMIEKMQKDYSLDEIACQDILIRAFSCLHGIGSLITFNNFEISDNEISDLLKRTVRDMVQGAISDKEKEA